MLSSSAQAKSLWAPTALCSPFTVSGSAAWLDTRLVSLAVLGHDVFQRFAYFSLTFDHPCWGDAILLAHLFDA